MALEGSNPSLSARDSLCRETAVKAVLFFDKAP